MDKLLSLQKHLQTVKNQASNPSKKHLGAKLASYKEWVRLEIKRTEKEIERLKA